MNGKRYQEVMMRIGNVEKELLKKALLDGRLTGMARARRAERDALERLQSKGLMHEAGGIWFPTGAAEELMS